VVATDQLMTESLIGSMANVRVDSYNLNAVKQSVVAIEAKADKVQMENKKVNSSATLLLH